MDWKDLLIAVVLTWGCFWVLVWHMDCGVVPHDSGTLGHSAERILEGQLPHKDFHTPYTGLLGEMHALVFWGFGISLLAMRYTLLAFSLVFIPSLYLLLRRALNPMSAVMTGIVAFMWSLPNYFSSMPSWYNLFFATFGLLALMRFTDVDRLRWLFLAGAFAGISFLFKSVGVYFAAATVLFLLFREQLQTASNTERTSGSPRSSAIGSLPILLGLLLPAAFVVSIFGVRARLPEFLVLALPPLLVTGFLAWNEWRLRHDDSTGRLRRVSIQFAIFLSGCLLPVAIYLIRYAAKNALGDWIQGVFITPQQRLHALEMSREINTSAFQAALIASSILMAIVYVGTRYARLTTPIAISLAMILGVVVYFGNDPQIYPAVWECVRLIPLILTVGMIGYLHRKRHASNSQADKQTFQQIFLVICAAGWFAMIQYPITHGIYLLYAAPLIIAAVGYATSLLPAARRWPIAVIGSFLVVFSAQWVITNFSPSFGDRFSPALGSEYLKLERGQVRYDTLTTKIYEALIREVQSRTPENAYILALPDCPEVYFLSGRKNPTPTFFDAFDKDYGSPAREQRLLNIVDEHDVNLIVMRNLVSVSTEGLTPSLIQSFAKKFPYEFHIRDEFNTIFLIRWREPSAARSRNYAYRSGAN